MRRRLRAGIVTLYHRNCNYGGLLQAYALQRVLARKGIDAEVLNLNLPFSKCKSYVNKFKHYSLHRSLSIVKRTLATSLFASEDLKTKMREHQRAFSQFEELIPHSELITGESFIKQATGYDILIAGSDQIWNPGVWEDCLLLKGIDGSAVRKVSYAASMGCTTINQADESYLEEALRDYYAVSMREPKGKEIVSRVYDGTVSLVLDPTLLIEQKEWVELLPIGNKQPHDPYALIYLVNKECRHIDRSIIACKEAGLQCVVIPLDPKSFVKANDYRDDSEVRFLVACSPNDWLNYLVNARVVLTDSFHGLAFSVIFNKAFWCFEETGFSPDSNKEDRREAFLSNTNLVDRIITADMQIGNQMLDIPVEFSIATSYLEKNRIASLDYIDRCLSEL